MKLHVAIQLGGLDFTMSCMCSLIYFQCKILWNRHATALYAQQSIRSDLAVQDCSCTGLGPLTVESSPVSK
jgi:hypothetical protein